MPSEVVIPKSEFDRITSSLLPLTKETAKLDAARALQIKSKERVKGWSNTLVGERQAAEAARKQKVDDEEAARQRVDEEEARLQLAHRREKIERANALLAKESDRVKTFSTAMMLSDVLAEREAQVRFKEELIKLERVRDEKYQDVMKHNYRAMLERELREKHALELKQQEMSYMQKTQLQETINRRLEEIKDNLNEGDSLRVKAAEDAEAERQRVAQKRAVELSAVNETQRANAYLLEIKERETRRSLRENARIAEYAKLKDERSEKIKARELQLFQHKQALKQKMIDRQSEEMVLRQAKLADHLSHQVAQKAAEDTQKFEAKEAKRRDWQRQLELSRDQQIQRRLAEAAKQKEDDAAALAIQRQMFARLEMDELDEANERKAACLRLAREQQKQIDMTRDRKRRNQETESVVVDRAKQAMMTDLTDFHAFAESVIKEYASDGKNVIPLIKELRNYRKHLE